MPDVDIGIVGAGPAGAWAAYQLARAGARVVIFDDSHPREKPCGGGVTGRALSLIADALPRLQGSAVTVSSVRVVEGKACSGAAGRAADVPLVDAGLSPDSTLVVVSRAALDAALLQTAIAAGARLITERVVNIVVSRETVEVHTRGARYTVPWVLGADGANSLTRRRVSTPLTRAQLSIGTGFFAGPVESRDVIIEYVGQPPGYIWSFPRPDHLAIGVCAQADASATPDEMRRRLGIWIGTTGLAPHATLRPYSWPIPSMDAAEIARARPMGERWMLLGDAAGLVDPITREGIYFALQSGILAADALAAGRPERYAQALRDEIFPELQRAARLKAGFFRPSFVKMMADALRTSEAVRNVMVDLVGGRQPYRGLGRRLFGTLEVGLAWRLIRHRWHSRSRNVA